MRLFRKALLSLAITLFAACQASFESLQQTTTPSNPQRPPQRLSCLLILSHSIGHTSARIDFSLPGIDFSPGGKEITLRFWPSTDSLNQATQSKFAFCPRNCEFGDHPGMHQPLSYRQNGEVIWISVHSGVGGEGQEFRHALEGTGINSAGLGLEQVQQNLDEMEQASITLQQGKRGWIR
jgi:hypothetical protein